MWASYGLRALLAGAALSFCTATHADSPNWLPTTDVADADNEFGFRLLDAVQKSFHNGNVVFSPVSAALALAMLLDGAEGETREEILSSLALTGRNAAAIDEGNAFLIKTIHTLVPGVTLAVADSVWVDSRYVALRSAYTEKIHTSYGADITGLDFADPSALTEVNGWASKVTAGKIPQIIDHFGPHDRLLLLNAVYFKGQWTHKFDKSLTQRKEFVLADGAVKKAPRMAQSALYDYFETPELQAVRLPFGDGNLAMEILLPAQASNLEELRSRLTVEQWRSWRIQYASRPGMLELPRFELKSAHALNEPLQALGMRRAFRPDAQLTGMFSSRPARSSGEAVFVSSVRQSAYWKIDEEGSEAAAVTSIGVRSLASARPAHPFSMIIDRPFFCAIEDRRTGVLLFIGTIYDPTAS